MAAPQRYVVSATLLTCSPLAIHSGMGSQDLQALGLAPEGNFREPSPWNEKALESCDQLVVRDWQDRPYIPGSSLKGVIREFLERPGLESQPDTVPWLLGRPAVDSLDEGEGGAGVFEDAFLAPLGAELGKSKRNLHQGSRDWLASLLGEKSLTNLGAAFATIGFSAADDAFAATSWRAAHERLTFLTDTNHLPYWSRQQLTYVEHHVGVDRRTGTASEGKLFTAEVVPAGLPFRVQFIVDHGDHAKEATRLLLRALAGFNLDPVHSPIQLGSGTNHGWGRMACLFSTVRVESWTPAERRDASEELNVLGELQTGLKKPPEPRRPRVQIGLGLKFDGPFLVKDPAKVCVLEAVEEDIVRSGGERKAPDHVPRVAGTQLDKPQKKLTVKPLLPATGFKGPVRAQLERILRTVYPGIAVSPHGEPGEVNGDARDFVRALFGFKDQESGIWCSEFVGTDPGKIPVKREMVAIDRFTGGASEHAKFEVLCLDRPTLEGMLTFDLPPDAEAAGQVIGAGILLLRDLIEGDVAFGLGDMKGFGQCRAEILSLAVAGQERVSGLVDEIEGEIGTRELNRWMAEVLAVFKADASGNRPGQAALTPDAKDKIAKADAILDTFLDALRHAPDSKRQLEVPQP